MKDGLVSVIVLTRNSVDTIEMCLKSIKNQIYSGYLSFDCYSRDIIVEWQKVVRKKIR